MPWISTNATEERTKFILAHKENLFSVSELSERFAISRTTAHKWINRYESEGLSGLNEHFRVPHSCPHQTPPAVEKLIVECREKHPYWGPKKLRACLSPHIMYVLSKELVELVMASLPVALPLAWFAMDAWLSSIAYRIDINVLTMLAAAGLSIGIAALTSVCRQRRRRDAGRRCC